MIFSILHISSLMKVLAKSYANVLFSICFFILTFESSLYILVLQYLFCDLSFYFLNNVFLRTVALILLRFNLTILYIYICAFCIMSRKRWPTLSDKNSLSFFFSMGFVVLSFIKVWDPLCCEVDPLWCEVKVFFILVIYFWYEDVQLIQHVLLRKLSFLHWIIFDHFYKITDRPCLGLFLDALLGFSN